MANPYLQKSIDYCIEHKLFETGVTVVVSGETSKKVLVGFILSDYDSVMAIVGHPEEPYVYCLVHFSRIQELEGVWKNE